MDYIFIAGFAVIILLGLFSKGKSTAMKRTNADPNDPFLHSDTMSHTNPVDDIHYHNHIHSHHTDHSSSYSDSTSYNDSSSFDSGSGSLDSTSSNTDF